MRPVNSIKHVFDTSFTSAAGVQVNTVVMDAVQSPVLTSPTQTAIGATVGSIYLSVEAAVTASTGSAIPQFYMIVFKDVATALTAPDAASVGTSDVKRYVLHQEMVMLTNISGGAPRSVFRGVIKLPRTFKRQGNDDTLRVSTKSINLAVAVCIQCIYKEFR